MLEVLGGTRVNESPIQSSKSNFYFQEISLPIVLKLISQLK